MLNRPMSIDFFVFIFSLLCLSSMAYSQTSPVCQAQWNAVAGVGNSVQSEMQTAADKAKKIGDESSQEFKACIKGALRWEEIHWALDLPEVTVKDQKLSLDLPESKLVDKEFSYNFPETTCTTRCDGPTVPVLVCSGLQCKFDNRPSCYPSCNTISKLQKIVIGIPETKMVRKDMVMGLPEVTMKRVDMRFNSLSFYPSSGCVGDQMCSSQCKPAVDKATANQQSLLDEAKKKSNEMYSSTYTKAASCTSDYLQTQRALIVAQFDGGINSLKSSIAAQASKPEIVAVLSKQLSELELKKAAALTQVDQEIEKMKKVPTM